jgi:hypothetical protein
VFAEQVLFQVKNLGKVISLHLNVGFAHLLPRRRDVGASFQQDDSFVGIH